ncbi:MAG TPA: hypothetical protein VNS63_23755 [Blastocatellia bacterium]|nr:hypothetical protein [Blastocatellia bacterium]
MTEFFTLETFTPHVNTTFLMHYGDSQTAELNMTSATDVGSSSRQIQISLKFQAPVSAPVAQGIYRLDHDKMGVLDMFLVPIDKDAAGVYYEAIFNRPVG